VKAFIDSNIIVYAFSDDPRRETAIEVIAAGGVITIQILNEVANVLLRKLHMPTREVKHAVSVVASRFGDIPPITRDLQMEALDLVDTHCFSFFDALHVAAALHHGCDHFLSEDLQHGRLVGPLAISNPFLGR
jgi:predicted nucleic acid-binding protein